MGKSLISNIPNMNCILDHESFVGVERERVKIAAQAYLDELRENVLSGNVQELPALDECAEYISMKIDENNRPNLRGLVNATGVVLHTNLGRAPLGKEIIHEIAGVFGGYCNLEYDIGAGRRGSRYSHVEGLICELTGAQSATVVNNNAAAVFIALRALALGKRVAVSRGELVEIGGSFRVPEIMENSGAVLIEVGTTNKTRLKDYAVAVSNKGAEVLLKVHTSNYEIVGFAESAPISELASFGAQNGLPVIYDMGSCFLVEPESLGLNDGETAASGISAGADLICFSGDKLLGSTQAGIIAGRADFIDAIKKDPLARMIRPDKLTLSALESTLRLYRYPNEAKRRIPTLAMISAQPSELKRRAEQLAERIRQLFVCWEVDVCESEDETGGGSLPNVRLPGWAVSLRPDSMSVSELEQRLRLGSIPVIIRIHDGRALISPRTLLPGDDDKLLTALSKIHDK
ncbi:MAG: L-seryl-tRNA(Sec) selenium transferase [Oscillospiraceae bacterium]|jgi:L-seryl-tRNA(Ser) seleniumtransferase|nr:L-seryl-tRNA(Sec) selenium transferase [Oscillospiraceae bacterium]